VLIAAKIAQFRYNGISTQVPVGVREGLKYDSCIRCDELMSIPKNLLTDYIGHLSADKLEELNKALRIALAAEYYFEY
jgi:mRNA interferase MazF